MNLECMVTGVPLRDDPHPKIESIRISIRHEVHLPTIMFYKRYFFALFEKEIPQDKIKKTQKERNQSLLKISYMNETYNISAAMHNTSSGIQESSN